MQEDYDGVTDQEVAAPDEQEQEVTTQQPVMSDKEYNFRALERAKNAEIQRLAAELESLKRAQQKTADPEPDEDPDDYVQNKTVRQLKEELVRVKAEVEAVKQHKAEEELAKITDLQDVLSEENIMQLNKIAPRLAASIKLEKDPYKQAAAAYEAVKNLVIGRSPTVAKAPKAEKPRSVLSAPRSAIDSAKAFAESDNPQALLKEMMQFSGQ